MEANEHFSELALFKFYFENYARHNYKFSLVAPCIILETDSFLYILLSYKSLIRSNMNYALETHEKLKKTEKKVLQF